MVKTNGNVVTHKRRTINKKIGQDLISDTHNCGNITMKINNEVTSLTKMGFDGATIFLHDS